MSPAYCLAEFGGEQVNASLGRDAWYGVAQHWPNTPWRASSPHPALPEYRLIPSYL